MDCVNCGAPLPPKTARCPFCQTLNDIDLRGRVTVQRGTTSRDCPRCSKTLTAVLLGVGAEQVEIDRCEACHGLFFDPGELDSVLEGIEISRSRASGATPAEEVDHRQLLTLIEHETPTDDFEEVAYVSCPVCGQLMHRRNFGQQSGVIADTCRDHGLWLDGGELRRLIRWTQAGGRRHDAAQEVEKKRLEEQLRRTPSVPAPSLPEPHDYGMSDPFFGRSGRSRRSGRSFDAFDLARVVVTLARWLR